MAKMKKLFKKMIRKNVKKKTRFGRNRGRWGDNIKLGNIRDIG